MAACSSLPQPPGRGLPARNPRMRKNGRSLEHLFAARLDGVREACRHVKSEFPRAGRAIARDDAVVAPLHHARAELMVKLRSVDQQKRRPPSLRLPGKQRKRGLERAVRHLARQPSQLKDALCVVMDDFPPGIACNYGAHSSPLFGNMLPKI